MKFFLGLLGLLTLLLGSVMSPQRAYAASIGVVSVTVKVRPPAQKLTKHQAFISSQRLRRLTYQALMPPFLFARINHSNHSL